MNPLSTLSNAYGSAVSNSNNQYNSDTANQNTYQGQYNSDASQAQAANQNLQNYTNSMQGAYNADTGTGNAGSAYNYGLNQSYAAQGFNPQSLGVATQNLEQQQGALQNLYASQAAGANGMGRTQSQLANFNNTNTANMQGQLSTQSSDVNSLQQLYQNALTSANQFSGVQQQGEQTQLGGLNQAYQNYLSQQQAASSMAQFYGGQAQNQQNFVAGLAPSYGEAYGQIQSSQASAAAAQAAAAQTALQNQQIQNALNSSAYTGNISLQGGTPNSGISIQGGGSPQNAGTFNLGNLFGNSLQGGGISLQ